MTVTGTDGTRMSYAWKAGAYRCTEIKDRNGNFITINHDEQGLLQTVKDTLGRVITVHYDTDLFPTSITQDWKENNGVGPNDAPHTWASFTYTTTTINTDFSGVTVFGPPNSTSLKVLEKITYPDSSYTKFLYNSYGQVKEVQNFAASSDELNHIWTNLAEATGSKDDCPRFTQTKNFVKNFNDNLETIIENRIDTGQGYNVGGMTGTATRIQVWMPAHPDHLRANTFVAGSGWNEGLTIATENCLTTTAACSDVKRWTWTSWAQDDPMLNYPDNPRMTETRVGDGTNVKKADYKYLGVTAIHPASTFGLVEEARVYDIDLTTVLKKTVTTYKDTSAYIERRIIGLPGEVKVYGTESTGLNLMSKVTYDYDYNDGFNTSGLNQNISPVQHDPNYGVSFITGRGNLTSTTRWDVTPGHESNSNDAITASVRYNTAGSPVAQITSSDSTNTRTVRIGYTDSFNSSPGISTYAYPTTITDPAGDSLGDPSHSSTAIYRYDTGANIRAQSPAPAGNSVGKITERRFDSVGRLSKETTLNSGAYMRYEYPQNGVQFKAYLTIIDTNNNNTADAPDEVLMETWADGAGRKLRERTPHPGSTGGWAGTITEYDILGRVNRQSVPTEISVPDANNPDTWQQAGDDLTRGFLWTYQKYDWKDRVVRKINTDGDPTLIENDSDILISYDGCGCGGGQVTTIEEERLPAPVTGGFARRKRKIHQDILGRIVRNESYEWNGTDIYSTTVTTLNGRDQVLESIQYAGSESGSHTHQSTAATYDGFGRLKTSHKPEQIDSGNNLTYTTYSYNLDDSIASVTDARGAVTHYTYNDPRGLLTQTSYSVPTGSTIPIPANVTFAYDNVSNRTQMTDGLGTQSYTYDQLSRLTSETRSFTGFNSYTLNYTYGLGGQLTSLVDPTETSRTVNYVYDAAGRLTSIGGAGFGSVSQYLSSISYRAFGPVKSGTYGSGKNLTMNYNNRLVLSQYTVDQTANTTYQFYADGRTKSVSDQMDNRFDRLYKYDHLGRITTAKTGLEARDESQTNDNRPFRQSYSYNEFDNVTSRTSRTWDVDLGTISDAFSDNRRQNTPGETTVYDSAGRETFLQLDNQIKTTNIFDAAGQRQSVDRQVWTHFVSGGSGWAPRWTITQEYDGDGQKLRQVDHPLVGWTYYIRSSVLGGAIVSELNNVNGTWYKDSFVYALGTLIGQQHSRPNVADEVRWNYMNPVTGSQRGTVETELDPLGVDHGVVAPEPDPPVIFDSGVLHPTLYSDALDGRYGCSIDGAPASCDLVSSALDSGSAAEVVHANLLGRVTVDGQTVQSGFVGSGLVVGLSDGEGLETSFTATVVKWSDGRIEPLSNYLQAFAQQDKPKTKTRVKTRLGKGSQRRFRPIGVGERVDPPYQSRYDIANEIVDKYVNFYTNGKGGDFEKSENLQTIRQYLVFLLADLDCEAAFEHANLATPASVIKKRGLTLAGAGVLFEPQVAYGLGLNEATRRDGLKSIDNPNAQAFTPGNKTGRVLTFYKNNAFVGAGILTGFFSLEEVVVHETIHEVGVEPIPRRLFGQVVSHDLGGFSDYNTILAACRFDKN